MLQVPVVGVNFRPQHAKAIVRDLTVGDTVKLVADPHNQYDTSAVAVHADDVHIGFVPKESNSAVFAALMEGHEIEATVIAFENSLRPVIEFDIDFPLNGGAGEDGWSAE